MKSFKVLATSVALLCGSGAAHASTIYLDYISQSPGARTVKVSATDNGVTKTGIAGSAGQINFNVVDSTGTVVQGSLLAWCLDVMTYLNTGKVAYTTPADILSSPVVTNLDRLFTQHYAKVVDADTSAGFQLAIWEILYDTVTETNNALSGLFDLATGDFQVTKVAGQYTATSEPAAEAWAKAFLNLGSATGGYKLTFYDSANGTDQRPLSQDLVSASPIPLPAPALMLIGGLGALAALRRRKARQA